MLKVRFFALARTWSRLCTPPPGASNSPHTVECFTLGGAS